MNGFRRIDTFRIRGRRIISSEDSETDKFLYRIYLPHGINFIEKSHSLLVRSIKSKPLVLIEPKNNIHSSGLSQLYPYYETKKKIQINKKNQEILFWQVVNDKDKFDCQMLIANYHHRPVPGRGAILACKLPEISQRIIGCAVLDKMTYTSAINNRSLFLDVEIENLKSMSRGYLINNFGISWASRFVVEKELQGKGIGKMLAENLKDIAAKHFVPTSNFIEVYATLPDSQYKKHENSKKNLDNFLTRANYQANLQSFRPVRYHTEYDEDGFIITKKGRRIYYYCDVKGNQDRLFVPLNTEAYNWFKNNNKQWEVRNYKGQFKKKNVYVGRKIELRKGYSNKNSSIWGIISEVRVFKSIYDLFEKIEFNKILPMARNRKDAIKISKNYLAVNKDGSANIIAIKVNK